MANAEWEYSIGYDVGDTDGNLQIDVNYRDPEVITYTDKPSMEEVPERREEIRTNIFKELVPLIRIMAKGFATDLNDNDHVDQQNLEGGEVRIGIEPFNVVSHTGINGEPLSIAATIQLKIEYAMLNAIDPADLLFSIRGELADKMAAEITFRNEARLVFDATPPSKWKAKWSIKGDTVNNYEVEFVFPSYQEIVDAYSTVRTELNIKSPWDINESHPAAMAAKKLMNTFLKNGDKEDPQFSYKLAMLFINAGFTDPKYLNEVANYTLTQTLENAKAQNINGELDDLITNIEKDRERIQQMTEKTQ